MSREAVRRELEAAYAKGYEEAQRVVMDELKALEYERDIAGVYDILRRGTEAAREVGKKTLDEVRHAMRIDYFDDKELISEQQKRFDEKNK